MPSEGGYLEVEGIEKTWRIKQDAIAAEVDILSLRKQFDIVLPGSDPIYMWNRIFWRLSWMIIILGYDVLYIVS